MDDVKCLLDLEPEAVRCPHDIYRRLRQDEPVRWLDEIGCFAVSRYADVLTVLRAPELFSSRMATGPASATPLAAAIAEGLGTSEELRTLVERRMRSGRQPVLLNADPPLHMRQRNLVNRAFSPARVSALEPLVRSVAENLVDEFVSDGEVDLVSQFCVGFPLAVIADALGVPRSDLPIFKHWSDQFVVAIGNPSMTTEQIVEMFRSMEDFYAYFSERIAERQRLPQQDLLTDVVQARLGGTEPLSTEEMLGMLSQFLVAGNETTTKMLSSAMLRIVSDPELMATVRADLTLIPQLVEEVLRLESPVQGLFRTANTDTEIAGVAIPAGSHLWLIYGSANRDEAMFPSAESVDLQRTNAKTHLAFGQGPHFCLGAPLARAEGRIGLEVLLTRLADIRLAAPVDDLQYEPSFVLHGLKSLRLAFQPSGATA